MGQTLNTLTSDLVLTYAYCMFLKFLEDEF